MDAVDAISLMRSCVNVQHRDDERVESAYLGRGALEVVDAGDEIEGDLPRRCAKHARGGSPCD